MSERVLIVDFGSQVTQLIARRVREAGVYSEVHPFNRVDAAFVAEFAPIAIVLSGGPASVLSSSAPTADPALFEADAPVLGICYGQQLMAAQMGARVLAADHREFGRATVEAVEVCALFEGLWELGGRYPVWMSHGDRVESLPVGFAVVARSAAAPYAAIADEGRGFYGVQFHPEVVHTPDGAGLIRNFVCRIAGAKGGLVDGGVPGDRHRRDTGRNRRRAGRLRAFRRRGQHRRGAVAA